MGTSFHESFARATVLNVTLGWALPLAVLGASHADAAPNIVVVMVDDMGYGDPGCFNPQSRIPTPNVDALAEAGMAFTDAHAPGPLCHMSRYGLLTGRFPFRTDVSRWRSEPLISAGQTTIASLARRNGYRTAMVGKWHLGFRERGYDKRLAGGPIDCGFDSFFGIRASTDIPPYFYIRGDRAVQPPTRRIESSNTDGWAPNQGVFWRAGEISADLELKDVLPRFTDEAIEVITTHSRDSAGRQPLMLYLAYPSPHTPWLPTEEFRGRSGAGLYGDFVAMVDAEIGRVLHALRASGLEEETLLVFTSDNGPCWYEADTEKFGHDSAGGLRGMKGDAWEAGHRMPFIVRWPGVVSPGSASGQTVCFTDLLATFADVMGDEPPHGAGTDSSSFLPVLTGEQPEDVPIRGPLVVGAGSRPSMMSVRVGKWKLITGLGSGGFSRPSQIEPQPDGPAGQLYDLAEDPGEERNVYLEFPEVVAECRRALQEVIDAEETQSTSPHVVDRSTLTGKVMCGYQGWFNTPDDGMGLGWTHWARRQNSLLAPGNVTVDIWPDISEFEADERYATGFEHADGGVAEVFSSADPKTVMRHFRWMREYGIDGVFLQRFANGLGHRDLMRHKDKVLENVRAAATATGRAYVVMYDLTGLPAGGLDRVYEDWVKLQRERGIARDEAYLRHNGRPLVAVWGVGFGGHGKAREYTLAECRDLVTRLKNRGCAVMLGVPTGWREQDRDAVADPDLHGVLKLADVLSPWTPGRYRDLAGVERHASRHWAPDAVWCSKNNLGYMPVVFPGFSWHNLTGKALGEIPRMRGEFLWSQMVSAKRAGAEMIYVAMFDEVDEGTAIFKCTDNPPVGEGVSFLTNEGLPSDHYLWLTGQGARMLRGEAQATRAIPKREP